MSAYRRDRRPDHRSDRPDRPDRDRHDRPPQRQGDWRPREQSRDRPYQSRGGDRPYQPSRPRYERGPDDGGMSIRLDPRRVNALKQLAGDAGMRPGDLVRTWVEERIDLEWRGETSAGTGGGGLAARIDELAARVTALESLSDGAAAVAPEPEQPADGVSAEREEAAPAAKRRGRPPKSASAAPSQPRVPLHEEMIAVISERGPQTAAELAAAIVERGRYSPPRSGKPLDAAMVSQRVSNPTYRSRFTRREGRIGLASAEPGEAAEPADAAEAGGAAAPVEAQG